ncbi:hypothetical protein ADK59_20960 [Streptomyces sp. XY332]|nr:hypothetical protein ADK59_20960 [Streptomyces sp. XY332]
MQFPAGACAAGPGSVSEARGPADTVAAAGCALAPPPAPLRLRLVSASTQLRCRATSSSGDALQRRASRSTGAYSVGTTSPLQYRCSVDVLMWSRLASIP